MALDSLTRATLSTVAIAAFGCGPTVAAATAYDAAHLVANQAETAHADLTSCTVADAGPIACDRTNKDLCELIATANSLAQAAQDAGHTPPTPLPPLPKFCTPR